MRYNKKYNITYHRSIKMKPVDDALYTYIDKVFIMMKKPLNMKEMNFIINYNSEEIFRRFYEKQLQKKNKTKFRVEKVINRKGDKLYVKYTGYDNKFNSWIDKKDVA